MEAAMTKYVEGLAHHATLEDRGDYLMVAVSGSIGADDLAGGMNLWEPTVQFCRERKCFNVLLDAREVQVDFRLYHMVRIALDLSIFKSLPLRVALIVKAEAIRPDHAFEAVAAQEGVTARVFADSDEALTWLLACDS
jgi:hypothetical protein